MPAAPPELEPAPMAPESSNAPERDYSITDSSSPAECLSPPPIDLQPAASTSQEAVLAAFEAQPTIDLPHETSVEMKPESPFESLPPLESFEFDSSLTEPVSQVVAELSQSPVSTVTPEADAVLLCEETLFEPENPEVASAAMAGLLDEEPLLTVSAIDSQPTAELPPAPPPTIAPESALVPLMLPPESDPEPHRDNRAPYRRREHNTDRSEAGSHLSAAELVVDNAITLRRSRGVELLSWLHNHLPSRPDHVPANAIEPTWAEQRTARGLATVLACAAVLSVLPVVLTSHVKLLDAPPWALWTMLLAAIQIVFAGWLANAPDWATVRVQMVISAALTTLYAMVLTLVVITRPTSPLILGLDEVRKMAPAWCGLMFVLMAVVTWYCGRTSTRWRRQIAEEP
jgi:hypothetical protein